MKTISLYYLVFAVLLPFVFGFEWRDSVDARWSFNCDFQGGDLKSVRTSGDRCEAECLNEHSCTHFTWTNYLSGTCWLKQGGGNERTAQGKDTDNAVCGFIRSRNSGPSGSSGTGDQINWNDSGNVRWAFNCDFDGNDLIGVQVTGENCGGECEHRTDCTHFTWTNYAAGTCWLKKGDVTEGNAKTKDSDNAVCGLIKGKVPPSPSPGTGEQAKRGPVANGKSTRYWDCCKPSCSWNGKAAVSAPVKTCTKEGDAADVNANSGCNGGPAFTCRDNQPIVINDNLSYGFAAAHITGQQEGDWCCACYELTFTDTAASGKKLIVQVTNTGGDLGENHFDLQIPGGGVGIFNGCSNQWGAPQDGWGQRYGGVGSASECEQLPQELKEGCKWRFNWFKNADNPNFQFQRVTCPSRLTDISGCRRNDD